MEALALEDPKASADLAGMPTREMQQLAKRYAAADYGVALQGGWREGRTRLEKLQESLRVSLWHPVIRLYHAVIH